MLIRWKIGLPWIASALILLMVCTGCASKEEKKAKHLERAKQYIEKSEFKKAVIELKNVVQLDPKNDAAYLELGETYLKLKQGREAFQAFGRAASINPDNLKAQLKVGLILLLGKKTEEARKRAELILEKSPGDIDALALLSGVQVQEKDLDAAIATLEKAVSLAPDRFKTQLSLGRLFLLKKDFDKAEKAYIKAISLDPSSRVPYMELSRIYGAKGKWEEAESQLKKMIEASGSKYRDLYILARFYESRRQWDKAEKTYRESVNSAPREDVASLMNLGEYNARRRSYDTALEAMKKASDIKKDDLNILVSIARLHFSFGKMKDAGATVDKVLAQDSGHVGANFLKGRLYLLKRDFANALERFTLVVRENPRNGAAYYFKALCLAGKGQGKLAEQDLVKAVELNPRLLDARLMLAESYLRQRNRELARRQIDIALKLAPANVKTLMLQGNLKALERDYGGAEAVYKKVVEQVPKYAPAHVRLGLLHNVAKRPAEALKSFKKALELNPLQTDALTLIVSMYVRDKKYDEAVRFCEKLKKEAGKRPSHLALIEYLEGNVYMAGRDPQKARTHYEEAIRIDPNILVPYVALARIHVSEKKLGEAISQYETILKKNSKYLPGYMALGAIYDQQGERKKAEAQYRKALEIKGDFAPAANNLAWNLADGGGNIDEALGFAQIAKEKMPNSAAVMDTLGWIYYLKGSYLSAIAEFRDSLERDPDNPVINYHLGMAYFKNNQPDAAREPLEKALKIDENFKHAEEARRVLKEIKASAQ